MSTKRKKFNFPTQPLFDVLWQQNVPNNVARVLLNASMHAQVADGFIIPAIAGPYYPSMSEDIDGWILPSTGTVGE